jgi:hypothetical protein
MSLIIVDGVNFPNFIFRDAIKSIISKRQGEIRRFLKPPVVVGEFDMGVEKMDIADSITIEIVKAHRGGIMKHVFILFQEMKEDIINILSNMVGKGLINREGKIEVFFFDSEEDVLDKIRLVHSR